MYLVVDDHPVSRKGLEQIIHMYYPEEEILEAGTVHEAMSCLDKSAVSIAFVDLRLGEESGFDLLKWLKESRREVRTICITSSSRESDFFRAREMGVDAYILKDAFIEEIMFGLRAVQRGSKFYSSALMEKLNLAAEEEKKLESLTEREVEVLCLMSQGCSNAEIGKRLFITLGTVKKHVSSILGKLDLKSRVEAAVFAGKCGGLRALQD